MARTIYEPEEDDDVAHEGRAGKVKNVEDAAYTGDGEWEVDVEFEDEEGEDSTENLLVKYEAGLSKWVSI